MVVGVSKYESYTSDTEIAGRDEELATLMAEKQRFENYMYEETQHEHEIKDIIFYYNYMIALNAISFTADIQAKVNDAITPWLGYNGDGPIPAGLNRLQEEVKKHEGPELAARPEAEWRKIAEAYWATRKSSGIDT